MHFSWKMSEKLIFLYNLFFIFWPAAKAPVESVGKTRVFPFGLCHSFIPTAFVFWHKRHYSHFLGKSVCSSPMPRSSCYLWNHGVEAITGSVMRQQGLGEVVLVTGGRCHDNFLFLCSLLSATHCFPWIFSVLLRTFLLSFSSCSSNFARWGVIASSFGPR